MYREDFKKVSEIGKAKTGWLKENPIGYFVAAMVAAYFTATAAAKSALDAGAMFVRGILCNICVCLAVWCSVVDIRRRKFCLWKVKKGLAWKEECGIL